MSACSEAIARRFGDAGPSGEGAEGNDLICRVLSRKTVRRYSERMPAEDLLDLLVACALSASAKSDFQQASILRVRDQEKRAAIGKLFPAMPWIGIAPVFFVFLGDARRLQRVGEMRGKPVENGTLEGFFNASIDAALAMQTMILCAESAGLGVCPISVIRNEVDKVAAILGYCNQHRIAVQPQGGMTGLSGGAVPAGPCVVLSLERMRAIREIDAAAGTITVEAGALMQSVQQAADAAQLFFPLDLGGRGSCQIGGNISTNAGGNRVLRFGMARDLVLGIEAVLADGSVIDALRKVIHPQAHDNYRVAYAMATRSRSARSAFSLTAGPGASTPQSR